MIGELLPAIPGIAGPSDIAARSYNLWKGFSWPALESKLVAGDPFLVRIRSVADGVGMRWQDLLGYLATKGIAGELSWVPDRFFGVTTTITPAATAATSPSGVISSLVPTRTTAQPASGTIQTLSISSRAATAAPGEVPTWAWVVGGAALAGGLWLAFGRR